MDKLTLAYANIENLLLNNCINLLNEEKEYTEVFLSIPDYQRDYTWTTKQASQLLYDVIDAFNNKNEKYRIGTIILNKDSSKNTYNIVDGQQRLITLAIILFIFNEFEKKVNSLSIDLLNEPIFDSYESRSNITSNYQMLKRIIKHNQNIDKDNLLKYIKQCCELMIVITDDISTAFQFFESQNVRGKALDNHDLLKAYHIREMYNVPEWEIEELVERWQNLDEIKLASLFDLYLKNIKAFSNDMKFDVDVVEMFKGINKNDNNPSTQYYKGAYEYAHNFNLSSMPFVIGIQKIKEFQINAPVIAGKPFFDYTFNYYDLLEDVVYGNKIVGNYIKNNEIIKTLDLDRYTNDNIHHVFHYSGDKFARFMFDSALILYIDKFCQKECSKEDSDSLNQFIIFSFIWAYSLRAQMQQLKLSSCINYINEQSERVNSLNIYKCINELESSKKLLNFLNSYLKPISKNDVNHTFARDNTIDYKDDNDIYVNYMYHFKKFGYLED